MMQRPGGTTRFVRYGLVGVLINLLGYGLFLGLHYAGMPPVMAASLCYVAGVAMSYMLNRSWTFASSDSHLRDLPKFLLAYGIGLASTLLTIALLTLWLPPELAQILNIALTALVIYASLRLLRFGRQGGEHAH